MRAHLEKHGKGRTMEQYTNDALKFFQENKHIAREVTLQDGSRGLYIRTKSGGGYWTLDGKIVTFWD